ncbi:MAG: cold-shock protein [Candidatus Omnitrophota bacterium]
MAKGTVKWFHRKKGYGFITSEKGEDVFVHYTTISGDGFKFLEDGEAVEFELEEAEKGLKAKSVTRLNKS